MRKRLSSIAVPALLALTLAVPAVGTTLDAEGATVIAVNEAATNEAGGPGTVEALAAGGTVLDLTGSGFQSVAGGMGGIYVAFGWVTPDGDWAPSAGGVSGTDYLTAPDDEQADNDGYLKFVTFPGSQTEAAANGGVLNDDGTWATELAVPPATFEALDRDGNSATVNCLEVTCGVITIGAHNIKNANNETFTPVTFVESYAGADSGSPEASAEPTPEASTEQTPEAAATDEPANQPTDAPTDGPDPAGASSTNLPMILAGVAAVLVLVSIMIRRWAYRRLNGK